MKIRHDFVTNSSSSSFIINIKKDLNELKLDEFIKNNNDIYSWYDKEIESILQDGIQNKITENSDKITNIDQIINLIKDEYYEFYNYEDIQIFSDEDGIETINKYLKCIENGSLYYTGQLSDCENLYYIFRTINTIAEEFPEFIKIEEFDH